MILTIDIETVPRPGIMDTWFPAYAHENKKIEDYDKQELLAGLYPEFGMICCVAGITEYERDCSIGMVASNLNEEKLLLKGLSAEFESLGGAIQLQGHNIKGFDIPFLAKRYLAHRLPVPECLQVAGKKPWEIHHIDTMELAKFGGHNPSSLRALCLLLNIKDPKTEMTGIGVYDLFKSNNFEKIKEYCEGDVKATRELGAILRGDSE